MRSALPSRIMLAGLLVAVARADNAESSLKAISEKDWSRDKAAHLLRRAGFYGTPAEIDRLAALGVERAVHQLVDYESIPDRIAPPAISPELLYPLDRITLREVNREQRRRALQERRRLERAAFEETRLWWIERMIASPRPLEEKMTLLWHGHLTSGMREVRNAIFMKEQNEFLRRHALGSFRDLLEGISRDRAMLVYLDGRNNHKQRPNENYARELVELFTLGEGNYTEADVKAAARALTGWTFDRFGFVFRPRDHDYGTKQFLGRSGRFNGDDIIEIILDQPDCSRFLARRLLEQFVRPDPDRGLVENLARELRRNDYELRPVMRTLLMSEAFYHPGSWGCLIKSPVELLVGTARMLGVSIHDLRLAERALAAMGQELMQPPNVKGWDGGEAWINTATLLARYNVASGIILGVESEPRWRDRRDSNDEIPADHAGMATRGRPEARSRLHGQRQPPFDPMPWIRGIAGPAAPSSAHGRRDRAARGMEQAQRIVDRLAGHMLAVPLSAAKREQLVDYLLGDDGEFDVDADDAAERVRAVMALIASTPEFQLY